MKKLPYLIISLTLAIASACSTGTPPGTGTLHNGKATYRGQTAEGRANGYGVLYIGDSVAYSGQWKDGRRCGYGTVTDTAGRTVTALWAADTIVYGTRRDTSGVYNGEFNRKYVPDGHGAYYGRDGQWYDGAWRDGARSGFGVGVNAGGKVQAGEWQADKYKGERMTYTAERIYGIDISRYQHGKGRKRYAIDWGRLRITHLGNTSKKKVNGRVDYPVSFVYIKATEGISVGNPYFKADYTQARKRGIPVGAYHFFSPYTDAARQARYFLRQAKFARGDLPPVLDIEPTHAQIKRMGGVAAMFSHIRTWLGIVGRGTGTRPILYVSQQFVNKYLPSAPDLSRNHLVWIARYGAYRPEVRLAIWQLCPDGRVSGIHGPVDVNVFNGYHDRFGKFLKEETIGNQGR